MRFECCGFLNLYNCLSMTKNLNFASEIFSISLYANIVTGKNNFSHKYTTLFKVY